MRWKICWKKAARNSEDYNHRQLWTLILAMVILAPTSLSSASKNRDSLVLYYGTYTDTSLLSILTRGQLDYKPSTISVAGWNRRLDARLNEISFESEFQVGVHNGIMRHMEANGALVARWSNPMDLPLSFALGEGISFASRKPDVEHFGPDIIDYRFHSQETNNMLNYLLVEMEVKGFSNNHAWPIRPFMRIHHRSGVYGTYCPPTCGSNFVTYGMKFDL